MKVDAQINNAISAYQQAKPADSIAKPDAKSVVAKASISEASTITISSDARNLYEQSLSDQSGEESATTNSAGGTTLPPPPPKKNN